MRDSAEGIGTFDYVIVGAGTAGCVLANRLSADPKVTVLLLEAGGKDSWIWIHIPIGYLYTQNNPRTDWCFRTEPEPGLNGRQLNYPRGRVLGGCSSINGMIYMRGQARDYDGWRQQGNRGWGWDDVLPYFKRSEHHVAGRGRAARGRRRVAGRAAAPVLGDPGCLSRRGGRGGHPERHGLQPRQQRGLRLLSGQPAPRRALEHRQGLLAPRAGPGEPYRAHRGAGPGHRLCGQAGHRRALRPGGTGEARRRARARCCWRQAQSARRSSCSSPAWALPRSCRSWAYRSCMRRTASAPTCRTTCRSARSTRCDTPAP